MQIIRIPPGGIMFEEGNVKFAATNNVADQAAVVYHWRREHGSATTLEKTVEDVILFNCERMGFHQRFCRDVSPIGKSFEAKPNLASTERRVNTANHTCKTCGAKI